MSTHSARAAAGGPVLPPAMHLGFAGSRQLWDPAAAPDLDSERGEQEVFEQLRERLRDLPQLLGLLPSQVLCGVSQVAIGADTAFARACQALRLPHRVLLPQPVADYLAAVGSDGAADFTPVQQAVARALLAADNVIEQRVVSQARQREARFEDCNGAILHRSDAVVCLERTQPERKPGGTGNVIARAQSLGKPVLVLQVSLVGGHARVSPLRPLAEWPNGGNWRPPAGASQGPARRAPPTAAS